MMETPNMEILFQAALGHHQAGRLNEAQALYEQVLSVFPNHAGSLHLLGGIAYQKGDAQAAMTLMKRSLEIEPNDFGAWHNLGEVYRNSRRFAEAEEAFKRSLRLKGDFVPALEHLGMLLIAAGRHQEAALASAAAARLSPDRADLWFDVGVAYQKQGNWIEADAAYRRSLAVDPRYAPAWNNLGLVLRELGDIGQAADYFERAISFDAHYADPKTNLLLAMVKMGDVKRAMELVKQTLSEHPTHKAAWSNYLYFMQFDPATTHQSLLEAHQQWEKTCAAGLRRKIDFKNDRNPEKRLRVGFVSADFRDHIVLRNILPLLRELDRKKFEAICYSDVEWVDSWTDVCRRTADVWVDCRGLNDDELADRIVNDQVDILVDLACHSSGNRMHMFARKPAPVQVSWVGYPGTTGLKTMDYRMSDGWIDPLGEHDGDYVEKTWRLKSYWCYDPQWDRAQPGESALKQNGFVTYGCLCQSGKVSDEAARTWGEILAKTPKSKLILLGGCQRVQDRILKAIGVPNAAVEFVPQADRTTYLHRYHRIDVALDTFPYNGPSTAMDALRMGVPVVTLAGMLGVGRGSLSVLGSVGMSELATRTTEQYIDLAVSLGRDVDRLAELRRVLPARMEKSPMMDVGAFARDMEDAFRGMWKGWLDRED